MNIQEEKQHWEKKLEEGKNLAANAKKAITQLDKMRQPSCIELFGSVTQERSPYFSIIVKEHDKKVFKTVAEVEAADGIYIASEQKDAILTFVKEKYKVDYASFV